MRIFFIVICLFGSCAAVIYRLSDEEHGRMPRIMHMDPYERCLRMPAGRYCSGYLSFVSDQPSSLLEQMQGYSEFTPKHFNYTRAFYGTCVSDKCKLETKTNPEHILEACLNRTVWNDYKLHVKLEDNVYCVEANEKPSLDVAGRTMVVICLVLLILNVVGSLYDTFVVKKKEGPVEYLLLCFSLRRNWRILVASENDKDPRDVALRGIYGIRAISMILVVNAHAIMVVFYIVDDTLFLEKLYDIVHVHLLLNGTLIMQTFLVMSSFLLMYNLLRAEEKYPTSWKTLPKKIWSRWLQLKSASLVLAITATWLKIVGDGPVWNELMINESINCRKDWWIHLLHLNNYFGSPQCMPHTWYLATDFQLYCLGMLVFVVCRSPKVRNRVLTTLFLIGMVVNGLHTYFQDLDAAVIIRPSTVTTMFTEDRTFNITFKRGHTNIPSYVLGLALGYFIYHVQKTKTEQHYKKWRAVYWAMCPAACALIISCKLNYAEKPPMDVVYRAMIACVLRPTFGFAITVIVAGTVLKIENVYRGVLEWRGWRPLSRVSYSVFLVHVACIKCLGGSMTGVMPGNFVSFFQIILIMLVSTYLTAYLFFLTVEAPLSQLMKTAQQPTVTTKTDKTEDKQSEKKSDK